MADQKITVRVRVEDSIAFVVPNNVPVFLRIDDTISYNSPDGEVQVEFDEEVTNLGKIIAAGQTATVTKGGLFFCKCFVTLPGGATIGWSPKNDKSGGVHDVRPRPGFP